MSGDRYYERLEQVEGMLYMLCKSLRSMHIGWLVKDVPGLSEWLIVKDNENVGR